MSCERSKQLNAVSMLTGSFGTEIEIPSERKNLGGSGGGTLLERTGPLANL